MILIQEIPIHDFNPWQGGETTYRQIEDANKLDELENLIQYLFPEGISDTDLNDWLWFSRNFILQMLGIEIEQD